MTKIKFCRNKNFDYICSVERKQVQQLKANLIMAKKLTFVKFFNNVGITGKLIKTEKVYDDETEMKKMFDECVGTFETYCKMFGQFARRDYEMANGEAMGNMFSLKVEDV